MTQFKTQPDEIADWLGSAFPGAEIKPVSLDDRFAVLFRIYDRDRSPFPELVVTWEALEDWTAQQITTDFSRSNLADRLRGNPGKRLKYSTSRRIEIEEKPLQRGR